jgi:endo-1,4-beta-xylanase
VNLFAELGLENQVTEFDMSVYHNSSDSYRERHPEALARQAARYREFFEAFHKFKGKLTAVTFWGVADDHTWLKRFPIARDDQPLLFDESLRPKSAFWAIVDPQRLRQTADSRSPIVSPRQ